ncbi:hypothetical protein [Mucilaginibacter terrae]|uniref:Uncharacterized protein n=1 Tax=Mucilaginibacter terrae TaxID=1955052 RepID=A0ABU3GZD9_9SPHI|nr:hypothetical protein [Mucilaginibacter terrae]MDT3405138.1 hypothetical protein [Mucilaginibacter terrae]
MLVRTSLPLKNVALITGLALLLLFGGPYLLHHLAAPRYNAVANGLLADVLVTFPAAYYFLIIRPLKLRKRNILFVVSCCLCVAYLIMPPTQQAYILQLRKLSVAAELGFIIYAISKVRSISKQYRHLQHHLPDVANQLQHSMTKALGNTMPVRLLASELTVMRFSLLYWLKTAAAPYNAISFSTHKQSGYASLFGVILFVAIIELAGFHLLLLNYSVTSAIVVTALSIYGLMFLIADFAAIIKSPVLVHHNNLLLRVGIRWHLFTTCDNIASATKITDSFTPPKGCFKGAVTKGSINMHIVFKQPVNINRLYGSTLQVRELVISIDQADEFLAALSLTPIVH